MSQRAGQSPETKLKRLRGDYDRIKQQIAELGHVVPGTLIKRSYTCGHAYCHCKKDGTLHGPYYHWTRKVRGKTVSINLDEETAPIVQKWIDNKRQLRKLCTRLEKTSLEILRVLSNRQNI
jgi:hypothetical protein